MLASPLLIASAIFVATCLVLGGGPGGFGLPFVFLAAAGLAVLMTAVASGALGTFQSLPFLPRLATATACSLPFVQLVPLPPSVWRALPGHELRTEILVAFGMGDRWMPLSATPAYTAYSAVIALSMFGLLVAALHLSVARVRVLLWTAAGAILLGALIGVVQYSSGGEALQFHPRASRGALIGFFANKNHMGLALACLAPLALTLWRPGTEPTRGQSALLAIGAVGLLALLVATNSRAGLGLGLLSSFLVAVRLYPRRRALFAMVLAGGAAALYLGARLVPVIGDLVERFGRSSDDVRVDFFEQSLPLASRFGLTGSGLGSFSDVFATIERLTWVKPTYLNAAHNDYLQIVIEAGLLGAAATALIVAAVLWAGVRLRSVPAALADERLLAWFGLVVTVLFAIHSFVDYPARRAGTLVLLTIAVALLFRQLLKGRPEANADLGVAERVRA